MNGTRLFFFFIYIQMITSRLYRALLGFVILSLYCVLPAYGDVEIMKVGETRTIKCYPVHDWFQASWYSSDPSSVKVIWSAGTTVNVQALKPTKSIDEIVTLTCFYQYTKVNGTQDSGYEYVSVFVEGTPPTSVSLPTSKTIHLGETLTLTPMLTPNDAYATFTWKSSDEGVATVSSSGVVTPSNFGKTTITVTTDNNLSATCVVTVEKVNATSISITSYKKMIIGDSETIKYNIYPSNSNNSVSWSSSNEAVVSVTQQGVVTARKAGTANIKVETDNGKSDICVVTVPPLPNQITLPQTIEVNLNKSVQLNAKLTPTNALDYLLWNSDNEAIATVDENGMITGHSAGKATVTVRSKNVPNVYTTCVVTVTEPEYKLIVWTKDGSKVSYRLNKRPTLIYNDGNIVLSTTETVVEYRAEDVNKYTFENPEDNTNSVQQPIVTPVDARLQLQGETILLEQCEPYSVVQIYAVNGKLMDSYTIGADGTLQIAIGQYPKGIYIIKTKHLTHKIVKR